MGQIVMSVDKQPRAEDGKWLPGVSYAPQRKTLEYTLRRVVAQDKKDRLRAACERLLDIAANGEDERNAMAAFSIIADRLDGKAVARIETNDTDSRNMGLADLVALVLQARKADAIDAPSDTPPGMGDIPMKSEAEGSG
jgi:hypothetical protein